MLAPLFTHCIPACGIPWERTRVDVLARCPTSVPGAGVSILEFLSGVCDSLGDHGARCPVGVKSVGFSLPWGERKVRHSQDNSAK